MLVVAGMAAVAAALAVCSGGAASSSAATGSGASAAPTGADRGGATPPGTSGTIAAVTGNSMEVQNPTAGQVTVTWTSATTFTRTQAGSLAEATVGSCVTAGAAPTQPAGASPSAGAHDRAVHPTSFTATTVQIAPASAGSCDTARGPGGSASSFPRPSASHSGTGGSGGYAFGDRASGKVTAVAGDVLTVAVPAEGSRPASTDTVTTTAATTFTDVVAGTAADVAVGGCAFALGPADDTGSVAATRVALSSPGPSGCTTGFGRRGGASGSGTPGA